MIQADPLAHPDERTRTAQVGTSANRLLAAMPGADIQRWAPHLKLVDLALGQVISEPGSELGFAYFPIDSIVSLLYVMNNGESAEIALVGNDGMLGVTLFMGGDSTTIRAVVQSAGTAYRLPARELIDTFARGGATPRLLLLYTQSLLTQMTQTAACNRHHQVDQQLSRWLLANLDRRRGNELTMTHERIASMLGVRREGVSESAFKLQKAGVIRYARGQIMIIDRKGLEERSCECYAVVKKEYDRLLPARPAS